LPDKDILSEKITQVQHCLTRIKDVTKLNSELLDDYNIQDVFILNLQRAIQSCIDIAVHISSTEGWGVAKTIRENFVLLADKKVISKDLAVKMTKMVGFRNIAIHDYSNLDVNILKSILKSSLKDIEEFYSEIYGRYFK
jgi:uncharacterized protein YutE (UPF0331/DUF86 family)